MSPAGHPSVFLSTIDPENTDGTYPLPGWNGVQENTNPGTCTPWICVSIAVTAIRSTLGSSQSLGIFVHALPDVSSPVNNSNLHGDLGKNGKLGPTSMEPGTDSRLRGLNSSSESICKGKL